jgi:hypothetical protein
MSVANVQWLHITAGSGRNGTWTLLFFSDRSPSASKSILNGGHTMKLKKFAKRLLFSGTRSVPDRSTSAARDPGLKPRENVQAPESDREYWVRVLATIADPVLESLSEGKLKERMPVEVQQGCENRRQFTHLEAFGRLMAGMAPWLELGPDNTPEGKTREKYIRLYLKGSGWPAVHVAGLTVSSALTPLLACLF